MHVDDIYYTGFVTSFFKRCFYILQVATFFAASSSSEMNINFCHALMHASVLQCISGILVRPPDSNSKFRQQQLQTSLNIPINPNLLLIISALWSCLVPSI